MSLDVYLEYDDPIIKSASSGIFIREQGRMREITRAEWDSRFPGREPVRLESEEESTKEAFWRNITHNLTEMAAQAGIYGTLWRPEELGFTKAKQLIEPLQAGLDRLVADPEKFRAYNPENGWGSYEALVEFVRAYLEACRAHPEAQVRVSR